jgi:hypothetical protein
MQNSPSPLTWLHNITAALQWPLIVISAFALGRYVQKLETRVMTAEGHVKALIERHLPHVHRALADIKGKLETIQALLQKGK